MLFEMIKIDQHPSRMNRGAVALFEASSLVEAEKKARGYFEVEVLDQDTSYEGHTIFHCRDHYAYELRQVEEAV